MKFCSLFLAGLLFTASTLMAQLPLVNLEHPGWTAGATPFPVAGSAACPVTRSQSHSGAQSVQIPVAATGSLHAIKVNGTINSGGGGGVLYFDFHLKPAALMGSTGFGLNPATQSSWDYSILAGGLRLVFVKSPQYTGVFAARGLGGETRVLPGNFPLRYDGVASGNFLNSLSPDWIRVTVRYDAAAGKSDVFLNGKLAIESVPVSPDALPNNPAGLLGADGLVLVRGHTHHATHVDDIQVTTLNPMFNDADRDGMSDDYEVAHGQSPVLDDRTADPDSDTLENIRESIFQSNPHSADSDGDTMPDVWEILHQLNPNRAKDAHYDLDGDGATNAEEHTAGTDPWSNPNGYNATPEIVYVRNESPGNLDGSQFNPFDNIQTALNVVQDGGTVVIDGSGGPMSGYGNYDLYTDKFLHIHGVQNAVIDCEGVGGAFQFYASSYSFGRLPLNYDPADPFNPVVWYAPAAAGHTIRDITFRNVNNSGFGAITVQTSTPLEVTRCTFENCGSVTTVAVSDPMALYITYFPWQFPDGPMATTISRFEDCIFRASSAGGLVVDSGLSWPIFPGYPASSLTCQGWPTLSAEIVNCRFESNTAAPSVRITAVPSSFTNCVWLGNDGGGSGGVMVIGSPALPAFTHCTVLDNDGTPAGALQIIPCDLGTIYYSLPWGGPVTPLTIHSSIFWGNTPQQIDDLVAGGMSAYSTIQDGYYSTYSATVSTANPLFLSGSAWLSANSPAIDAADPASPVTSDVAGQTRTDKPGTGTPGTIADQGAYEFSPDTDGDGFADLLEEQYGLDPANPADASADNDADGFSNAAEIAAGTDFNLSTSLPVAPSTIILVDALNGNDANNGSPNTKGESKPVKTITRALTLATATTPAKTIVVRDGTYAGTLNRDWNFYSKAVTIRSVNGPARTIIDLGSAGRTARIPTTQPAGLTITGLSFRNGSAPNDSTTDGTATNAEGGAFFIAGSTSAPLINKAAFTNCWFIGCTANGVPPVPPATAINNGSGGAIRLSGQVSVTATNCQFLANKAIRYGGAVYAGTNSQFTATGNTFSYNEANGSGGAIYGNSGTVIADACTLSWNIAGAIGHVSGDTLTGDGGAVYLENPAVASCLLKCRVEGNAAFEGGGGIYLHGTSSTPASGTLVMDRCQVFANLTADFTYLPTANLQEDSGRYGGGIAVEGFSPIIQACVIRYNECGDEGGGLSVQSSAPTIRACAILDNWSLHHGGGLLSRDNATPVVQRCTIVFNAANSGSGGGVRVDEDSTGKIQLYCSILWNNIASSPTSPSFSPGNWNPASPPAGSILSNNRIQYPADLGPNATTPAPRFLADGYHLAPDSPDRNFGILTLPDVDGESPAGTPDRGCDEFVDTDNDLLADILEWQIINASNTDAFTTLADVTAGGDYDGDGVSNYEDQFIGQVNSASNQSGATPAPTGSAAAQAGTPGSRRQVGSPPIIFPFPNNLSLNLHLDDGSNSDGDAWKVTFTKQSGRGENFDWEMAQNGQDETGGVDISILSSDPAVYKVTISWKPGGEGDHDYNFSAAVGNQPPLGPKYIIVSYNKAGQKVASGGAGLGAGLVGSFDTDPPTPQATGKAEIEGRTTYLIPVVFETTTEATQPDSRSRKKIGIGEKVEIKLTGPADASVTWAIKSGEGTLSAQTGKVTNFIAGGKEEIVPIEATLTNYLNEKVTVDFSVITPKTVFFEKTANPPNGRQYHASGIEVTEGPPGIQMGFWAYWYYGPDDVCFYNVVGGETQAGPDRTGWFLQDPDSALDHPAWCGGGGGNFTQTVESGKGTKSEKPDEVSIGAYQPPTINQAGRFEWKLKWKYHLKDPPPANAQSGTPFFDVVQWFEIIPETVPGQGLIGFYGKGGKGNVSVP